MDVHTTLLHFLANSVHKRRIYLVFFFEEILLFFQFLNECYSQIAGNDRHELEIMFDVSIVLFLSVDISIVLTESKKNELLSMIQPPND